MRLIMKTSVVSVVVGGGGGVVVVVVLFVSSSYSSGNEVRIFSFAPSSDIQFCTVFGSYTNAIR